MLPSSRAIAILFKIYFLILVLISDSYGDETYGEKSPIVDSGGGDVSIIYDGKYKNIPTNVLDIARVGGSLKYVESELGPASMVEEDFVHGFLHRYGRYDSDTIEYTFSKENARIVVVAKGDKILSVGLAPLSEEYREKFSWPRDFRMKDRYIRFLNAPISTYTGSSGFSRSKVFASFGNKAACSNSYSISTDHIDPAVENIEIGYIGYPGNCSLGITREGFFEQPGFYSAMMEYYEWEFDENGIGSDGSRIDAKYLKNHVKVKNELISSIENSKFNYIRLHRENIDWGDQLDELYLKSITY